MPSNLKPGLLAIHGNQLEQLRMAIGGWLRSNPLGAIEEEIFLVQSNGVAEWLKIALAEDGGICAATRMTLPGRFLWEAYRGMLGTAGVARRSALDKAALTWRLMHLLPAVLAQPGFGQLRRFLADGDPGRRLQLAQRLADLFDEYQVHRADWLADWAGGRDVLRAPDGSAQPMDEDQRWQAQLWRTLLDSLPEQERTRGRADVHADFLAALAAGAQPLGRLPRRVVVFGLSALPYQTLQALGALATRVQVVIAVSNPCRYFWGDIMQGRDLLKATRRRQQARGGQDLSQLPFEQMHAHSHPLLAGWGRQGRDFIRMLDEFDDAQASRAAFETLRIDLFSEGEGDTLLEQVQAAVRDLLPLDEHGARALAAGDRSIQFHVAHGPQREVEVLHDQLLRMFAAAADDGRPLKPREIVVMVPDIEVFSPAIRAVFGQYGRHDERHIPYDIADVSAREADPLLVALDWLLRLPQQRCLQSEVRDLLDVPALGARFGIGEADLPRLGQWIAGSGVRWGLDAAHRASLGLGQAGEQNAWLFGVRRMLLGYANGGAASYAGIEPYGEVGGLDAALAGALAALVEQLLHWRALLAGSATPAQWGQHARALLAAFFKAGAEQDRLTLVELEQALQGWLEDCETAGFDEAVPLAVLREAWLGALSEPQLTQRFVSGGVTFCTLMPMRAVPFRVVCLLGMNDGDYPRRVPHADFDLLALPGLARPGDRSRRDDDRYLMLEAVLAARDTLYVSWAGRSARDNSEQPPSVLVSQLRDYLQAGWSLQLADLTTEHPLQPFSRRYFEQGGLLTYAGEWRDAHLGVPGDGVTDALPQAGAGVPPWQPDPAFRLTLTELARFARHPVRYFFRQRLQVVFAEAELAGLDEEPFSVDGLEEYEIADTLLDDSGTRESADEAPMRLRERAARLAREGRLPIGLMGQHWQERIVQRLTPVRRSWLQLCERYPQAAPKIAVAFSLQGVLLEDWLDRLHSDGREIVWLEQDSGNVTSSSGAGKKPAARGEKLIGAWVRHLTAAAFGQRIGGYLVGCDALLEFAPLEAEPARLALDALVACWRAGLDRPLPLACKTALALLAGARPRDAYDGSEFTSFAGERADPCLQRLWPDYAALSAEPDWLAGASALYGPLHEWLMSHVTIHPLDGAHEEKDAA